MLALVVVVVMGVMDGLAAAVLKTGNNTDR